MTDRDASHPTTNTPARSAGLPPRAMPPRPVPAAPGTPAEQAKIPRHDDPTRYGDWEIGGRCIDF